LDWNNIEFTAEFTTELQTKTQKNSESPSFWGLFMLIINRGAFYKN